MNTWSGSFLINVTGALVAAAVDPPNATVAVLALDNDLAANCGTGNTTAKIQKKVVSGPAAAILVNPIECELEVDKTCCVTQPVLPDLDDCEGELEHIEFEYTGHSCSHTSNHQGGKCECYGRHKMDDDADLEVETSGVSSTLQPHQQGSSDSACRTAAENSGRRHGSTSMTAGGATSTSSSTARASAR